MMKKNVDIRKTPYIMGTMKAKYSTQQLKAKPEATQIRVALIHTGITQRMIARELGVSDAVVSAVIAGQPKSRRVREYILARLGLSKKKR